MYRNLNQFLDQIKVKKNQRKKKSYIKYRIYNMAYFHNLALVLNLLIFPVVYFL